VEVLKDVFGELNGQAITSYTLRNDSGMEFTCIDYGCTITRIMVPDKNGVKENVVLGYDTLEEYLNYSPYFGCIIGRISGRIKNATFTLDDETFTLAKNENENHLHGGDNGFHNVIWSSSVETKADEANIVFSYTSPDGEEGFPGNLKLQVTYSLNNENEIVISYQGVSDQKTIVNLTNHSYFNLSGNLKRTILAHELTLKSDGFLELDPSFIPTGKVLSVEDTVFDFRKGLQIVQGVNSEHPQIKLVGGGYDHPFLLNANHQQEITLVDYESGRKLEIETDEPCVVLYTGNSLEEGLTIGGVPSEKHLGLCLETQLPPNMINNPNFPSAVLEANEVYSTKTKYAFKLI